MAQSLIQLLAFAASSFWPAGYVVGAMALAANLAAKTIRKSPEYDFFRFVKGASRYM